MNKFLSQFKNKYIIAPLAMFLFFVFVLVYSLLTSSEKIVPSIPVVTSTNKTSETNSLGKISAKRTVVSQKILNNYTNAFGPPDYVFQGTRTYGSNAMVYVYLKRGLAVIADNNTTQVYEQWEFRPMSLDQFKEKYTQEILDFTIHPTLLDE